MGIGGEADALEGQVIRRLGPGIGPELIKRASEPHATKDSSSSNAQECNLMPMTSRAARSH